MKYTFLCLANVILVVIGQVLFKMGVEGKFFASITDIIKIMFSPIVLSGLIIYAFTTILWLYILSKVPINRAHPIQALAYPIMLIMAKILFNESIPVIRWIGVGIIVVGIIVIVQ